MNYEIVYCKLLQEIQLNNLSFYSQPHPGNLEYFKMQTWLFVVGPPFSLIVNAHTLPAIPSLTSTKSTMYFHCLDVTCIDIRCSPSPERNGNLV